MKQTEVDFIKKTIVWENGITAETAILVAFKCNVQIIQCIDDLISYTISPKEFLEENEIDETLISKFNANKKSSKFYKDHENIAKHKNLIRSLLRKLLSDIYEQTKNNLGEGLSIVNTEQLNFIYVRDYEEKRAQLDYEKPGLADDIFPPVEPLAIEDYTIAYESLFHWFKKYGLEVDKWSSVEKFCEQSLDEIKLPRETRNNENSKNSSLNVYYALLQECAIQLQSSEILSKGDAKEKEKFCYKSGKPNIDKIAKYLCSTYGELNRTRSVSTSLAALRNDEVPRKKNVNKSE